MRKGVSEMVVAVLLLLIAVSLVSVVYLWSTTNMFKSYPEESVSRAYLRSRACLSLEEINGTAGKAYMRNCGLVNLTNFTFYIDGAAQAVALPPFLEPSQKYQITFAVQTGQHGYLATSDIIETPYIIR